jgi:hypothetical protein
MKLKPLALGLAVGIIAGVAILFATIWISIVGPGTTLELLGKIYIGYSVSIGGAFIGLIYGFIDGFIAGFLIAWLYNKFDK